MHQPDNRRSGRRQLVACGKRGLFNPPGRRLRHTDRSAVRKGDLGKQAVGIDFRKEREGRDTAADRGNSQHEHTDRNRQRTEPIGKGHVEQRPIADPNKPGEATVTGPLQPGQHRQEEFQRVKQPAQEGEDQPLFMGQMTGQHQQRLKQRHQQRRDEGEGHHRDELPHHPRDKAERQERDHGCHHARNHTGGDLHSTIDGCRDRLLAESTVTFDVVADNNRIVDNNPNRHQEGEHREHVERLIGDEHQPARPQHAKGNPEGHPEGNLEVEEQRQNHKDNQQPLGTGIDQHLKAIANID